MNKEEILNEKSLIYYGSKEDQDEVEGDKKDFLDAMDDYAKQECIEFLKFFSHNSDNFYSYEQLYELYLQSKK